MANDPWFNKVASLLPLNVAGSDADWRSLVGYADLTSSVSVELGSALTIVGAPTIATVGGRSAMLLNGTSAIYFTLTAGLNFAHTIVFEVYVASTTTSQSFLGGGPNYYDDDIQLSGNTSAQWGWAEQNRTQPAVNGAMTVGWHTVAFVFDGASTTRLYIDGVRVSVGSAPPQGSAINIIQLGGMSSNYAANGSAIRKFRAYRGVQKFTGASYTVADFGFGLVNDVVPAPWFEVGTPTLSDVQSKFGGYSLAIPNGSGLYGAGRAFGTNDFVVEGWFYPTSFAQSPTLFAQWGAALPYGWYLGAATDGYLTLSVSSSTDTIYDSAWSITPLALNAWQHVALVRRGGRFALFLNGEVVATVYSTGSLPTTRLALGTNSSSLGGNTFVGFIDDVRMTIGNARYPITAADPSFDSVVLAQPFRPPGGAWLRSRYRNKTVTAVGNVASLPVTTPFGAAGYAAYFDGAGDYLTLVANTDFNFGSGDFTIEAWVNPDNLTGYKSIFANEWTNSANGGYEFGLNGASVSFGCKAVAGVNLYHGGGTLVAGVWTHVAVSRQGTVSRVFVNGVVVATFAIGTNLVGYTAALSIGRGGAGISDYMKGYIADLRITKGVARYTADFAVPTDYLPTLSGSFTPPVESSPVAATGIAGFVKGEDGNPRARKVFAYSHETGALLGSAVSDAGTGAFFVAVPERAFVVALDDDVSARNAIVYDRLDPV